MAPWPRLCSSLLMQLLKTPLLQPSTRRWCLPMNVCIATLNPSKIVLGLESKEIKSQQWHAMLGEIAVLLDSQMDENKKIGEDLRRREDRYNKREQEYRIHIDEL